MRFEMLVDEDGRGAISLDGTPVTGIAEVQLVAEAGQTPRVILDVNVVQLASFDLSDASVVVPDSTAETLVLLGWTPPLEVDEQQTGG